MQLEPAGQVLDELLIGIGFSAADAMMEMRHREHDPHFPAQLHENAQQRDRICAPGDGHGHAVAGVEQVVLANVLGNPFDHS
jgi:hypothetical protein